LTNKYKYQYLNLLLKRHSLQIPCPGGTFRSTSGARNISDCQICEAGTFCRLGSTIESPCTQGYYCEEETTDPTPCPKGTYGERECKSWKEK